MHPKILHLTVKKQWFDLIACGEKTVEYRTAKPYWFRRLIKNTGIAIIFHSFDEIHFRNGYSKNAPFMRVRHRHTEIKEIENPDNGVNEHCFCIELGKIIEIVNWKRAGKKASKKSPVNNQPTGNNASAAPSPQGEITPLQCGIGLSECSFGVTSGVCEQCCE